MNCPKCYGKGGEWMGSAFLVCDYNGCDGGHVYCCDLPRPDLSPPNAARSGRGSKGSSVNLTDGNPPGEQPPPGE